LLLLQSENEDWTPTGSGDAHLNTAVCVGGEIPFDRFVIHFQAPPDQPSWKTRFPFLPNIGQETLSSSGLRFVAQATLLWRSPPISEAPYLVEVRLPKGDDATPPLVVLLDDERLHDDPYRPALADYRDAFAKLADALRPQVDPVMDPTLRLRLR